uniref:ubiquitinyl hydrolase 1 n=1 Tax=Trypanosoma vivax (strain Y486) TaxID=1055687 RepID=G0U8V6_TRYVY|nr:putative mitochondrial carrier protein [Trypanosoma vivax Y486]
MSASAAIGPVGSTLKVVNKKGGRYSGGPGGRDKPQTGSAPMELKRLNLRDGCQLLAELSLFPDSPKGRQKQRKVCLFASSFSKPPQARGMLNSSNSCFVNAIMQAVAFTPALAQLCVSAAEETKFCPTLSRLGKWLLSYWAKTATQMVDPPKLAFARRPGTRTSLGSHASFSRMDGSTQEDALEFLQELLVLIKSDLCALEEHHLRNQKNSNIALNLGSALDGGNGCDMKGWTYVYGRERRSMRWDGDSRCSFLFQAIFGGVVENHLKGKSRSRNHASVVLEGFTVLPVDVGFSAECSLDEALLHTLQKEKIYDEKRGKDLVKTTRFHSLPLVLFLQLRRWAVTAEGELVKLDNVVRFSRTLVLPKATCTEEALSGDGRRYNLIAFVAHRGSSMERGHYVTYLVNTSGGAGSVDEDGVILCNDTRISAASLREAVENEAVYLLVYQRKP